MTLEQIGVRLGLSRERIRQIKERAIQTLRYSRHARYLKPYLETTPQRHSLNELEFDSKTAQGLGA